MQKSTKKARYNVDESTDKMNDDEEITGDDFIAFGPSKLKNHGKNGNLQSGRGENDKEGNIAEPAKPPINNIASLLEILYSFCNFIKILLDM